MPKYFGTDGIRARAGQFPLTRADAVRLGLAAGKILKRKTKSAKPRWLLARDTRGSGVYLTEGLAQGLSQAGIVVFDAGVVSTPCAAFLTIAHHFDSASVISASHNPPEFNGIKFFTHQGRKWPEAWEMEVEKEFDRRSPSPSPKKISPIIFAENLLADYARFLISAVPAGTRFNGLRVAVDCSNGANHVIGPHIFKRLGAEVFQIGCSPNGKNINIGCGSQVTSKLSRLVVSKKCHFGVAFDGDGDRVIFVDEKGRVIDGDGVIGALARYYQETGRLKNQKVVVTVMANLGLRKALKKRQIKLVETPVGDKYVSEAMRKHRSLVGGEQSGHIILGEHLPTGDGLLAGVIVASIAAQSGKKFSDLFSWIKKYPQILLNVKTPERTPLKQLEGVPEAINAVEKKLAGNGRALIRYSGTEPLLRIMLEGPSQKEIKTYADDIAKSVLKAFSLS